MAEPFYREVFEAAKLFEQHRPSMRHPHKAALAEIAYPTGSKPAGEIHVTRWPQLSLNEIVLSPALDVQVIPNFYDYGPWSDEPSVVEWHVNFADPRLFFGYGSRLFAQDEMQVAEHPVLGSVREALLARGLSAMTSDQSGATPILVTGAERRLANATHPDAASGRPAGIYGNRFADAPLEVVRRATRRLDPPTQSNIVAMAAPTGSGEYTEADIVAIFSTAATAFAAARSESDRLRGGAYRTVIHSGFWGCGAFGGNRRVMIALQILAARAAGIDGLVLHAGDSAGAEEARRGLDVAEILATGCGTRCSFDTLVGQDVMLGYRWGVSDGN